MGPGSLNTNLGPGLVNTNSGSGLLDTNWGPRPVNTNWGQGPVNTNRGAKDGKYKLGTRVGDQDGGPGSGPEATQRAGGREIKIPCFALKLRFSHKKLYLNFHYFNIFISPDPCEA